MFTLLLNIRRSRCALSRFLARTYRSREAKRGAIALMVHDLLSICSPLMELRIKYSCSVYGSSECLLTETHTYLFFVESHCLFLKSQLTKYTSSLAYINTFYYIKQTSIFNHFMEGRPTLHSIPFKISKFCWLNLSTPDIVIESTTST